MTTLEELEAVDLAELGLCGSGSPPKYDEDEIDLLAFELWHLGSCLDPSTEQDWLTAEQEILSHGGSL